MPKCYVYGIYIKVRRVRDMVESPPGQYRVIDEGELGRRIMNYKHWQITTLDGVLPQKGCRFGTRAEWKKYIREVITCD